MPLTAKASSSDFEYELPPAGNHVARCYSVVDMGIQEVHWKGVAKQQHKIRIAWELPNELMEDGRPFSISRKYTLSLNEASNLYQDLVAWRGKAFTSEELEGFDVFAVLGAPAMINIVHNPSEDGSRMYANVGSVAPLVKGLECPPLVNDLVKFSLEEYSQEVFDALPDWMQKQINRGGIEPEVAPSPQPGADDDDIPF